MAKNGEVAVTTNRQRVCIACRLLGQTIAMLGASSCAKPARDMGLGVIEALLELSDEAVKAFLWPHLQLLLEALRKIAVSGPSGTALGKRTLRPCVSQPGLSGFADLSDGSKKLGPVHPSTTWLRTPHGVPLSQ